MRFLEHLFDNNPAWAARVTAAEPEFLQVRHVCETTIVLDAWERSQPVGAHGWIHDVADGLLRDLNVSVDRASDMRDVQAQAVRALSEGSHGAR